MFSDDETNDVLTPRFLVDLFHSLCLAHCQQNHSEDQTFYDALLLEDDASSAEDPNYLNLQRSVKRTSRFPLAPLYRTLGSNLFVWLIHDEPPWPSVKLDHINEIDVEFPWEFTRDADELKNLITSSNILEAGYEDADPSASAQQDRIPELLKSEICNKLNRLLACTTKDIILKFLGVSKTIGSMQQPPPPLHRMYKSYVEIHHPSSSLTVGARALSKHCHRASDCWWGECTGTEEEKNGHAVALLLKVLEDVSWVNVHTLPHEVWVVEVRCSLGYGLRWTHDGASFRGFLEPQMVDGHEKGWRH